MNCPSCGTQNLAGAKFCMECGTTLSAGCPNCGFNNLPGAKFCSECGTSFTSAPSSRAATVSRPAAGAPAPVEAQAESGAERRLVSILFADLVGFTPFAEERDSEDVRETLTRYFDLAREVIDRYGGTVEKFIGDAVMAVWGAPVAHEDDAERAVRAALDLVEAVQGMGPGIQARAGVLTGEAAVTLGATNQGMVAGDLVNTASRLQSVAPPGSVLVGEATQRASSAAIAFERAGDQVLKGKAAPVAAWRALRVVAERGGRNRAAGLEPPFVGRQDEMRLLKDLFHATGREKKLRVVSVIGPAGIGKSRLTWEFSKYIDGLVESVYWHSGRSPAYGEGISFWALGEMIRERCQLAESDDESTTRAKVAQAVAQWVTDEEERQWIERALLTLLGVEQGMAADQLFGAWRTFFERIAEQGTVVLAFEDMHFADTGLLDFVDHLLEWSRSLPIYVVTLARPDLIERRPAWGAGKRNFVSLYLEPLPEAQMRQLLGALVPGLPEQAVAAIVGRADGIPLYAVETVRMLVAEGRLVEEAGVYVPHGDLTTLAVPETLTALIASRLDGLDETERRLVHDAAVLGQSFTMPALAAVADVPEKDLEPRLAALVRRELLQREMDARSPERGQYAFVQALIREVAYNTLSKKDRKKLHLAAARHFESLGNDELAGALASHYLAAHANAAEGEEADALAGQARIALKAAATRAIALGSFGQAVTFFEQSLAVTPDALEQAGVLGQAADAATTAGRIDDAEGLWRRSLELRRAAGDRAGEASAVAGLGAVLLGLYRTDEAMALLEPAVQELADIDDEQSLATLNGTFGRALVFAAQPERAMGILDGVLEIAERRGMPAIAARSLMTKGSALSSVGRQREGLGMLRAARELAGEYGLTELYLRGTVNLCAQLTEFDVAGTVDQVREAIALARRGGHRSTMLTLISNLGYTGFLAGVWDEAMAAMEPLLAEDISTRDRVQILNNYIIIRAARGEAVESDLAELERLTRDMTSRAVAPMIADPSANAALAAGDATAASDWYRKIGESEAAQGAEYDFRAARVALWDKDHGRATELFDRFERTGGMSRVRDARMATLRAGLAALEGRPAEALPLYREALRTWRDVGAVWDEAQTGIEMAILLDASEPDVSAAIASTRDILERLRAKPYLERLDQAASAVRPTARSVRGPSRAEVVVTD